MHQTSVLVLLDLVAFGIRVQRPLYSNTIYIYMLFHGSCKRASLEPVLSCGDL